MSVESRALLEALGYDSTLYTLWSVKYPCVGIRVVNHDGMPVKFWGERALRRLTLVPGFLAKYGDAMHRFAAEGGGTE